MVVRPRVGRLSARPALHLVASRLQANLPQSSACLSLYRVLFEIRSLVRSRFEESKVPYSWANVSENVGHPSAERGHFQLSISDQASRTLRPAPD
jgi:hypothetical protein